ncbi:MAG TPA: type IV pilus secretin PilQ [Candidatus Acidoferrum sp.]|nr:type IV pilus secretin PilQ [Candidatus Acidoferrum sp.]HVS74029.1 type IV pilus secretin PilQ [Candidatus Acidoferrales bacterium]
MKTNWPAIQCGCLLLATLATGTGSMRAQAQESGRGAQGRANTAVISSVAVTQAAECASVRVVGEGHLDVLVTRIQDPERLVLEFAGARLAVQRTVIPSVSAPVRRVRLGQYKPNVARVVIDLTSDAQYEISQEASAVVITFRTAAVPSREKPVSTTATRSLVTDAGTRHANFRITPVVARPAAPAKARQLATVAIPKFELPRELTQPSVGLASFGGKPAKPDGPGPRTVTNSGTRASGVPRPATATSEKYTGAPLSVNLKEVDLRDFFRLIHEISGLNVVLDPAVHGSLTIVLDEVPWDQALDIVMQNNGLDKQLNGNVLRIATKETLKREAEGQRDLVKAQAEAIELVTVTRVLSYAKAATMKDTLKKFLTARGEILSDDRSNQLIIRDIPSVIPNVDNLIRQLDRKSQQVEIEARVISASRSFARDLGIQLGLSGTTTSGRSVFGGNQNAGVSPVVLPSGLGLPPPPPLVSTGGSPAGAMPLLVNLAASAATSGIFFGHRSPNFAVDLFISAAEAKGVGKLLSKPKITTQNNEKATVKQGTKIPVQTTINNTVSVQFIDAVLKLEVTPQVTADGTVYMDVLVENTSIDPGIPRVQGIPALDTQSAETKVTVADGGTVVIGGVIITSQRVDYTEVPLVGSLPIIGHLFRRQNINNTSQELIFILTPRIIPG